MAAVTAANMTGSGNFTGRAWTGLPGAQSVSLTFVALSLGMATMSPEVATAAGTYFLPEGTRIADTFSRPVPGFSTSVSAFRVPASTRT